MKPNMVLQRRLLVMFVALAAVAFSTPAHSQSSQGSISGVVRDGDELGADNVVFTEDGSTLRAPGRTDGPSYGSRSALRRWPESPDRPRPCCLLPTVRTRARP